MKKSKFYVVGIALIAIISIVALIIFNSNVIKKANIDNEKEVIASTNDKEIFGTFRMDTNWVKDPLNPENVIEMSSECSIVKAKIISIGEAKFLKMSDPSPYTAVEVQIEEVIEGTGEKGLKTIYVEGGKIKVSEFLKTLNDAEKEKMELTNITAKEAENMYISYESEEDYNLELNQEYIFILSNKDNSTVTANGFGIFVEENTAMVQSQNATRTFKNVLTGNKLNISNSNESI